MSEPKKPALEPWLLPDSVADPLIETAKKKVATLTEVPKPEKDSDSSSLENEKVRDMAERYPHIIHRALEAVKQRENNLQKVVSEALERGIISRRGAHCYFRGKYLGNGDSFVCDLAKSGFDLEAEIRMAVKGATGLPAPKLPGTIEEAVANGWQYVGARGESANFERRTARGFCQLVKAGIGGVLDVPFEATIKHGKPKRSI